MLLEFLSLQVPHSLALLEQHDLVCIADREDMRVVCRGAELSEERKEQAPLTIQQPDLGRVYAITSHGEFRRVGIIDETYNFKTMFVARA